MNWALIWPVKKQLCVSFHVFMFYLNVMKKKSPETLKIIPCISIKSALLAPGADDAFRCFFRRCCGLVNPKFRSHTNSQLPPKVHAKATIRFIPLCKRGFWMWAPLRPALLFLSRAHTASEADAQRCVPSVKCPPLHKIGTWETPDLSSLERIPGLRVSEAQWHSSIMCPGIHSTGQWKDAVWEGNLHCVVPSALFQP